MLQILYLQVKCKRIKLSFIFSNIVKYNDTILRSFSSEHIFAPVELAY